MVVAIVDVIGCGRRVGWRASVEVFATGSHSLSLDVDFP